MKKNLILFSILISLLSIAYFLEERGYKSKLQSEPRYIVEESDFNELKNLYIGDFNINFNKLIATYNKNQLPLSYDALLKFWRRVERLKIQRILGEEGEEFFKQYNDFKIDMGSLKEIEVGEFSKLTGAFFIKVNERKFLVYDESEMDTLYQDELDYQKKKYNLLVSYLEKPEDLFIDKTLIYNIALGEIQELTWESFQKKAIKRKIDGTTKQNELKKINTLMADEVSRYNSSIRKLLGTLIITLKDKSHHLSLYSNFNNKEGYFISKDNKYVYWLKEDQAKDFMNFINGFIKEIPPL